MVKPQPVKKSDRLSIYGGAGIQVVSGTNYFKLKLPYTIKQW